MDLDHIGVPVTSLPPAVARWRTLLGEPDGPTEEVAAQGARVAFPASGVVGRFLARRAEDPPHLALGVRSVDRALRDLLGRGEQVVDRAGRVGLTHPSAFGGVLVELVERP
jgi:hypothetical protein